MDSVSTNVQPTLKARVGAIPCRSTFRPRLTAGERRLLLATADLVLINLVLFVCVLIWHSSDAALRVVPLQPKWFITMSILWVGFGTILDVYNLSRSAQVTDIVAVVALAALLTTVVYLFIPWLTPSLVQRSYAFGLIGFSILILSCWRIVYVLVLARPAFWTRLLILGSSTIARSLERDLRCPSPADRPNPFDGAGYEVVGLIAERPATSVVPEKQSGAPIVGDVSRLVSLAREYSADEIVVALDHFELTDHEICQVLLDCYELGFRVRSWTDVYERAISRVPISYGGPDIQQLLGALDRGSYRLFVMTKQIVDIAFALLALPFLAILAGPLMLINALTSPGPLFHRQERIGKGGRPFVVIKFRSMIPDAEHGTGAMWSPANDSRVTWIGRWLRKTHLDELPQIINVLRGEMSLVGPRPERPRLTGELASQLSFYRARHAVRPGITGWAQVHQGYTDSLEDSRIKLEYDLYYIKHAGFYLDVATALRTAAVMIGFKGH